MEPITEPMIDLILGTIGGIIFMALIIILDYLYRAKIKSFINRKILRGYGDE